ncbi:MAG: glycosyltransferase [Pseudomonadota bacterium]
MSERAPISVIVPAYGPSPHLERCLAALLCQTLPPSEIIVFHTGSDDPGPRLAPRLPGVRFFHEDARQFAGGARNRGAVRATGDWLAFVDCDVLAEPDWLDTLARAAQTHPDAVLSGALGCAREGGVWAIVLWFIEFGSVLAHRPPGELLSGPSANLLLSRRTWEAGGGFRADLFAAEDGELGVRLRAKGHRFRLVPSARADHVFAGGLGHSLARLHALGRAAAWLRRHVGLPGSAAVRYPGLALLLPVARFGQMLRRLAVERGPLALFLTVSPLILIGLASWSLGFFREARRPTYPAFETACTDETSDTKRPRRGQPLGK